MAKSKRMFNSNLVNASSFKLKTSNKAKLLYFYIMLNSDDKGFCDSVDELIVLLDSNDTTFHNEASLDLLEHGYSQAIQELLDKQLLLVFQNNDGDKVYLVKQWYLHNQIPKDRITETTYTQYLNMVELNENNEYCLIETKATNQKKPKIDKNDEKDEELQSAGDDGDGKYDYSVIPEQWGFNESSNAVKLYVKQKKGEKLTSEEEKYLSAYLRNNSRGD